MPSEALRKKMAANKVLEREEAKGVNRTLVIQGLKPRRTMSGIEWEDTVNKRSYRRIIGGAAWPGAESFTRTCHMAILGEDVEIDVESGQHKIWLVYEDAAQSIEEMLSKIVTRMEKCVCRDWVMPVEEADFIRVEQWIKERRRRRLPVPQVRGAPMESFVSLNALMQARTVTTKSFFFGPDSLAAAAYASVCDQDFARKLNRFPQIGAVLYPLGYLDTVDKSVIRKPAHIPAEGGY